MKLIVEGETPAKKNSKIRTRTGCMIPSKQYQAWHESAMLQIRAMTIGHEAIGYPVSVSLSFFHGDLRRRDSDNGTSSILDTLVDAGVLKDDKWEIVRILNVYNHYDKGHARCEIEIHQLETTIEAGRESA
jgi:Holliday junction resolvase RusA-like endonuclease